MFQALSGFFILFCAIYTYIEGATTPDFIYFSILFVLAGAVVKWLQEVAALTLGAFGIIEWSKETKESIWKISINYAGNSDFLAVCYCVLLGLLMAWINYYMLTYFFGLRYA